MLATPGPASFCHTCVTGKFQVSLRSSQLLGILPFGLSGLAQAWKERKINKYQSIWSRAKHLSFNRKLPEEEQWRGLEREHCVRLGLCRPLPVRVSAWRAPRSLARSGIVAALSASAAWVPWSPCPSHLGPSRGAPPSEPARAADGPSLAPCSFPSRGGNESLPLKPVSQPPSRSWVFFGAVEEMLGRGVGLGSQTHMFPVGVSLDLPGS